MNIQGLQAAYERILGDEKFWNCVSIENARNGFLWCSINPGEVKGNEQFNDRWENLRDEGRSKYWTTLLRKLGRHLNQFGHMDLFPIHCSDEFDFIQRHIGMENPDEFKQFVELLKVSQEFIESLRPKLIVYGNASTSYLWGWPRGDWMGYKLKPVTLSSPVSSGRISRKPNESLFRITGINDFEEVIKETKNTVLAGTYLLLDNQNDNHFGHPEISAEDLDSILTQLDI